MPLRERSPAVVRRFAASAARSGGFRARTGNFFAKNRQFFFEKSPNSLKFRALYSIFRALGGVIMHGKKPHILLRGRVCGGRSPPLRERSPAVVRRLREPRPPYTRKTRGVCRVEIIVFEKKTQGVQLC